MSAAGIADLLAIGSPAGDATQGAACVHCGLPVPRARRLASAASSSSSRYCCFGCRLASELARPAGDGEDAGSGGPSTLLLRLGLGIFLTMNLMAFSSLQYSQDLFGAARAGDPVYLALRGLFAYLQWFLATGLLAVLGAPLLTDAVGGDLGRPRARLDATLLICVGVGAAYVLSAASTLSGEGPLHFDTVAMILLLVTLGNYLESRARRRAMEAARALLLQVPARAWIQRGDGVVEVAAEAVAPGDRVRVRPGEEAPADGVVLEGRSHLDESRLTGESRPRPVGPGEAVLAGTVSRDGQLWLRATRTGAERTVARTRELLERARGLQPPIQRLADRVAAALTPAVVLVAVAVLVANGLAGDAPGGLFDALSVLLISCPCALGLAAPLACHFALGRLAGLGVLVDSPATLERAARLRRVFLDKTGTLTVLEPALAGVTVAACEGPATSAGESSAGAAVPPSDVLLAAAAALGAASLHPAAGALVEAARQRGLEVPQAREVSLLPGLGVTGRVNGRLLALGGERLVEQRRGRLEPGLAGNAGTAGGDGGDGGDGGEGGEGGEGGDGGDEASAVFLLDGGRVLASFGLVESMREGARDAVRALQELGLEVEILSGDRPGPARRLAGSLGVPVRAPLLPEDKLRRLLEARAAGRGAVAMVGDGVNDAAALAAADVGFVLAGGTGLARQAGHVLLLRDRLESVADTVRTARHALGCIRLNLVWAFAYNLIGVGLAAAGYLSPVMAAATMLVSSLLVVRTSALAGRIAHPGVPETAP